MSYKSCENSKTLISLSIRFYIRDGLGEIQAHFVVKNKET